MKKILDRSPEKKLCECSKITQMTDTKLWIFIISFSILAIFSIFPFWAMSQIAVNEFTKYTLTFDRLINENQDNINILNKDTEINSSMFKILMRKELKNKIFIEVISNENIILGKILYYNGTKNYKVGRGVSIKNKNIDIYLLNNKYYSFIEDKDIIQLFN